MRFFHLSDLHLGKRVNGFSMLPDQDYILDRIIQRVRELRPEATVIAGDVYDRAVPPAEAVTLFDRFLCALAEAGTAVLVISGNHDAPERLAFASRLLRGSGVHIAPVYGGSVERVTLRDEYGPVVFHLLPFLRPAQVRPHFPEAELGSYTDALRAALEGLPADAGVRNVLVTHQFVTGASPSESEDIRVGGTDNVDAAAFAGFDYVALGHLHRPQSLDGGRLRYCGTPLPYSFSEARQQKSLTLVTLGPKGSVTAEALPLTPLRTMREKRGSYWSLTDRRNYQEENREDYLHITLTDPEDIPDALGKLRVIYPNLMKLDYDNARTRLGLSPLGEAEPERRSPLELFGAFYETQNGSPLSPEQERFARQLLEEIWEGTP